MIKNSLLALSLSLLLFQCGEKSSEKKETSEVMQSSVNVSSTDAETSNNTNMSICVWDKAVIRETPEDKGKYMTTVNLAEKMEFLNETQADENNAKKREYIKVKLVDGKEGWVIKDFVVTNAKPGALINDLEIYARPDLLAKTNKTFKRMDVVAVSDVQGEWCKITGKRTGGTWIESGWVKTSDLSYDEKDLAVAVYAKNAMIQQGNEKQKEELQKIVDNKDLDGSVFLADVRNKINELTPHEEYDAIDEEVEVDSVGE